MAGFAMSQVLWPQEAQWRLAREPADILDSPAMESIRKWFYRPKVISFCSSISLFLISSFFLFFNFNAFLRFLFVSVYFLSYWLVDRTRALVLFSSFLVSLSLCVGPARCCHLFRENSHDIPKCFGRRVTSAWYTCKYIFHWYAHEC